MKKIGRRVGAIQSADEKQVRLFGYGVYLGDLPHPKFNFPNPCIELDNDKGRVWGADCWWDSEEAVKSFIGNRQVVEVAKEADAGEA